MILRDAGQFQFLSVDPPFLPQRCGDLRGHDGIDADSPCHTRPLPAHLGLPRRGLPHSRLVPRRQVRHLGSLGRAKRARDGRLVCPAHVHPGRLALRALPQDLRPSQRVRLHGDPEPLEGRELEPGRTAGPLCQGRCQVLRRDGQPPRQPGRLQLQVPRVEHDARGPQARHHRRLGEGCTCTGAALRRQQPLRARLALVPDGLRL